MKKIVILIAILAATSYLIYSQLTTSKQNTNPTVQVHQINKTTITSVILQDVSKSIKKNGVELVTSEAFEPYFQDTSRNIDLYFGVIAGASAHKLLHVYLPASTLVQPSQPDLSISNIAVREKLKEDQFAKEKKFQKDSTQFFTERNKRIACFVHEVDSVMQPYKKQLTTQTDLATAIKVAETVLQYTQPGSKNYVLINSDGIDTYKKSIQKFNAPAQIILINASAIQHSSIDSIVTMHLESLEQAIQYSIHH